MRRLDQSGFTLIELTLAMALFSFALIFIVVGFNSIMGLYETGLAMRDTQQVARRALNEIVLDARGATTVTKAAGGAAHQQTICLDGPNGMIMYDVNDGELFRATYALTEEPTHVVNGVQTPYCPSYLPAQSSYRDTRQIITPNGPESNSNSVQVVSLTANISQGLSGSQLSAPQPQDLTVTLGVAGNQVVQDNNLVFKGSTPECAIGVNYCSITVLTTDVSLQGGSS